MGTTQEALESAMRRGDAHMQILALNAQARNYFTAGILFFIFYYFYYFLFLFFILLFSFFLFFSYLLFSTFEKFY